MRGTFNRTRAVFAPAPPSLNFQATPYKEKERAYPLSVVLFCLLMHVPFRIEAVIKILTSPKLLLTWGSATLSLDYQSRNQKKQHTSPLGAPPAPPSLDFQATPHKKRSAPYVGRTLLCFDACSLTA